MKASALRTSRPPSLPALMNWMQAVLTHPSGARAGVESRAAREYLNVAGNSLDSIIPASRSQTSIERLAIYSHAYSARLLECLENEFPVLRRTIGSESFAQFALEYVRAFPSRSYTLGRLSEHFIDHLRASRPPRADEASAAPDWADFVVDLAAFEQLVNQVFDGPGPEGHAALTSARLSAVAPEEWPRLRFEMDPSLRVLKSRFPVHRAYTPRDAENAMTRPQPEETHLVVYRRDYAVKFRAVPAGQARLIERLCGGEALGDALEAACVHDSVATECVFAWLQSLAAEGMILGIG